MMRTFFLRTSRCFGPYHAYAKRCLSHKDGGNHKFERGTSRIASVAHVRNVNHPDLGSYYSIHFRLGCERVNAMTS